MFADAGFATAMIEPRPATTEPATSLETTLICMPEAKTFFGLSVSS
jgi:hypothetical protein